MHKDYIQGFQLSPQQKRVWLVQQGSTAFSAQRVMLLEGELHVAVLKDAVQQVVAKHDILRTTFAELPGMKLPVQVVEDSLPLAWREVALTVADEMERDRYLDKLCEIERNTRFDLEHGAPSRFVLLRCAPGEHILIATFASLCADRRTLRNFFNELRRAYADALDGIEGDEGVVQYAQFSEWQTELLEAGDEEVGQRFWRAQSAAGLSAPLLPLEGDATSGGAVGSAQLAVTIDAELLQRVRAVVRQQNVPLASLLLACWQTLLWRLSGEPEILVHLECDGRAYEEMEDGLGLYARWPPVRGKFSGGLGFADVWAQADAALRSAREWQEYFSWDQHLNEVGGESQAEDSTAGVGFSFDEWDDEMSAGGVRFRVLRQDACTDGFKLRLACNVARRDSLRFEFHYDTAVFNEAYVSLIARQFVTLLQSAAAAPRIPVGELEISDAAERRTILYDWNQTRADYPRDMCLQELFEAQVERTPEAIAVFFEEQRLTYDELNRRANMLANYLRKAGVGAESRVVLCAARSAEMLVGLLGILKAGGAYVPLDPAQPKTRLGYMFDDARPDVVLTHAELLDRLPVNDALTIRLDADWPEIARESDANPQQNVCPDNLAYVIYTSGSTGKPKGVCITHRSVVNLAMALGESIYRGEQKSLRISLGAPLAFDSSVKQVVQLLFGHTLYVMTEDVRRDVAAMRAFQEQHALDVLECTPSQLRLWLEAGLGSEWERSPARLLVGGEALDESLWRMLAGHTNIASFNVYGPTECTVDATACRVDAGWSRPIIGRPLGNVRIYVLDEHLRPLPVGVAGELHVGGAGVGRGYLNHAAPTAHKFIPDPFGDAPGARLYKTGDLARWLPDGNVEFIGRVDYQVKIRGSRIELGEVESELAAHPSVRGAVVMAREYTAGDKRLVAYVVTHKNATPSATDLHNFLRERLPDYMIPAAFMLMDSFPLTPNGKVDRNALAAPDQLRPHLQAAFVAPRTPAETLLAGIWAESLGLSRVGVRDNFFELGGHSLLATLITSKVRQAFKVELPLRNIFEAPTVEELAQSIEAIAAAGEAMMPPIARVSREARLPLSFAQQRLWFLDQLESGSTAYHVPYAARLDGALDMDAMRRSLSEIVRRHEVLRTNFALFDAQPVQVIAPAQSLDLPLTDLQQFNGARREAEASRILREEAGRPFDLSRDPLIRARLVRLGEQAHLLALTLHHIVFDATSIPVLMREVATLYEAFAAGEPSPLAELPVQYADFAHWQRAMLEGEIFERQLDYWRRQLDGAAMLELPTDRPRPPILTYHGARHSFNLEGALVESLYELGRRESVTMFMLLLAAFQTLLHRYTSQEDIAVGTPIGNRAQSEIEGLIGFFLNTLVMRTDLSGDPTFRELLGRVRAVALDAYAHQDVPFEKLVEKLEPERSMSRTPFFQVMFSARNVPETPMQVPGLTISGVEVETGTAKFDLILLADEREGGISIAFEYNTDLFDAATIERMASHYSTLLTSIVASPEERLSRLMMLNAHEREQLLYGWNETRRPNAPEPSIAHLFEKQVERTPNEIALVSGDHRWTYRELDTRANQMAHRLQSVGVGAEVFVGILMHRAPEMMVSVLGVLKAGGAYVALDPDYPRERLAFMLEDTGANILLTQRHLAAKIPAQERLAVLCVDDEWESIATYSSDALPRASESDNLAYVTYTSGSTGQPKGIAMPQRSVLNLLAWQRRTTRLPERARTLQFASLSFDVSFQDMFSTWDTGGTLVLITEEERRDIAGLARVLTEREIQRLFIPAVALQQLAEGFCLSGDFSSALRKVIAGSEQLQITRPVARLFTELKNCSLHNEYGPSEAHVVTELALSGAPAGWPERPSIGYPIDNSQIYILDRHMQPVPVGMPGELMIGGAGLARGYLNRPDLSADKFIPDPFGDAPGARLYKTGDLARWLPNGQIEFLGRMDFQVKIRGFRVELGEVEAVLGRHPTVLETIVMARDETSGSKRLVAYVVAKEDSQQNVSELRAFMQETLPEYMIPSVFIFLDKLPLTPNGKVNRRALPEPDQTRPELERAYVAPRTALEELVVSIWSKVLGIEQVGIHDNFFELGGHSLLAAQVTTRIREAFGVELPLRFLFEAPTVAGLTEKMIREQESTDMLESIAVVLKQLAKLSDAEAAAMLAQERSSTGAPMN